MNVFITFSEPFKNNIYVRNKKSWMLLILPSLIWFLLYIIFFYFVKNNLFSKSISQIFEIFLLIFLLLLQFIILLLCFYSLYKNGKKTNIYNKISKNKLDNNIYFFPEISILKKRCNKEKYQEYGNINKINNYENKQFNSFFLFFLLLLGIFIINICYAWVVKHNLNSWNKLYLAGFNSALNAILTSFMAINLPKTKNEENESHVKKYKNILIKLLNFKILLNTIDLNSNKKINLQQYSFLPTYLYLLKNQKNIKKELLLWKKYLNNILFYNNIISIKIFKFINKEKILKLNSKKWQSLNDKINDILNSDYNNPKEFIKKYNDLIDYINIKKNRIKNSFKFNLILNIFKKYNINFYQEISNKRKITIDERDLEFNVWQLNYLEYLYSIIEFNN